MNYKNFLLAVLTLLPAGFVCADEHEHSHFDIFVGRPTAGSQTLIGGADLDGDVELDARIFEGDLEPLALGNSTYTGTEPGLMNPTSAWPLLANESITLNNVAATLGDVTSDLFYWDGTGEVVFSDSAMDLLITQSPATADSAGNFHDHPIYDIDDPTSTALPAGGIYLAPLTAQLDGLDASDTVFVLFVTGEEYEESVELAEAYVHGQLVPEPSSLLLAGLAICGLAIYRR